MWNFDGTGYAMSNPDSRIPGLTHLSRPKFFFGLLLFGVCASCSQVEGPTAEASPNIVLILADDMGIGDIGVYNTTGKISTPSLDSLAASGMRFTDAHSPSAVCTPTRYGLLTGRYAWRTSLKDGVLKGYSPLLIDPTRSTIASMLREKGYATAVIGKWHLGLGADEVTDYSKPLSLGPNDVGFDYFFGIPASLDMPPYTFLEDDRVFTSFDGDEIGDSERRRDGGEGFWRRWPWFLPPQRSLQTRFERRDELLTAQSTPRPRRLTQPLGELLVRRRRHQHLAPVVERTQLTPSLLIEQARRVPSCHMGRRT